MAEYSQNRISYEKLNEENYVGVDNLLKNKMGKEKSAYVPTEGNWVKFLKEDILLGNIRPYLRKIWFSDIEGGTDGDVLVIHLKEKYKKEISSRYLYHILADEKFFVYNISFSKGAKMPRGDKNKIMKYEFPIPSIEVQNHIVEILDKFHNLVNDISCGLPKEIELREKQYIYYREKILDFPKK